MAKIMVFRARITKHGAVRGRPRYAILIPMELSEKVEKEGWVHREVEVIIVEPDA